MPGVTTHGGGASLVIGGSGMLADATRWLARHHPPTLLVARQAGLFAAGETRILPLDLDWTQGGFADSIGEALEALPALTKALVWVHDPVHRLPALVPLLPLPGTVLVLGSHGSLPAVTADMRGAATVRLGSIGTPSGRRWLTHPEICAGAIAALEDGRSRVIGELPPATGQ